MSTVQPDVDLHEVVANMDADAARERMLTEQIAQALGALLSTYTDQGMQSAIDRIVSKAKRVRTQLLVSGGSR